MTGGWFPFCGQNDPKSLLADHLASKGGMQ
jgi:hypothetical protein